VHARIAYYHVDHGSAAEIGRRAEAPGGMLDIFRQSPGYVSYELVAADDGGLFSISYWRSWEQAEAAVTSAGAWVRENIAELATLEESHVGEVILPSNSEATRAGASGRRSHEQTGSR
jgi:heme-degrading monooxygenase HmoA